MEHFCLVSEKALGAQREFHRNYPSQLHLIITFEQFEYPMQLNFSDLGKANKLGNMSVQKYCCTYKVNSVKSHDFYLWSHGYLCIYHCDTQNQLNNMALKNCQLNMFSFLRHLFHYLSNDEKKAVKSLGYKVLHDLQKGMIHSPSVLVASIMLQNLQGLHFGKFGQREVLVGVCFNGPL